MRATQSCKKDLRAFSWPSLRGTANLPPRLLRGCSHRGQISFLNNSNLKRECVVFWCGVLCESASVIVNKIKLKMYLVKLGSALRMVLVQQDMKSPKVRKENVRVMLERYSLFDRPRRLASKEYQNSQSSLKGISSRFAEVVSSCFNTLSSSSGSSTSTCPVLCESFSVGPASRVSCCGFCCCEWCCGCCACEVSIKAVRSISTLLLGGVVSRERLRMGVADAETARL